MRPKYEIASGAGRSVIRITAALAIVALVVVAQVGCGARESDKTQRFQIKGTVVGLEKRDSSVTIAHEAIPDYMDAMTMPFKLKDERQLKDLAEGDKVQATLVVAGLRSWLEDLVVTRESVDPSSVAKPGAWVEPKPGDEIPDFTLIDQRGGRFGFHRYRGGAVVLTFIYTRCPLPDYCPLMTDNFAEIERAIKADSNSKTHLLSITVDPEYDTAKVLTEYAAAHSGGSGRWDFATGTKDEVKQVATYFGMQYWKDGDQVVHGLRTAIIGADGKLVRLYRGNDWKPDEIVRELHNLGL